MPGGISDTAKYSAELLEMSEGSDHIIFTNEIKGSKLAEIVRCAGLFVLPSDLEGLPLVMLEAMQEGIPVLASDIPPHQQLIGSNRGLLFEAGNVDSLVDGLKRALANPSELKAMAQEAQKYIKIYYSWDKIVYDNLNLYTQIAPPPGMKKQQF